MTGASAMSMFAALLDRSFVQIEESVADGRFFDRQLITQIADVWDNNTFPLVGVAVCRPGWVRERRARAALRWMAGPGPARRAWMIEQAAAAGYRLEPVLGPQRPDVVHYRDYLGQLRPGVVPLTAEVAASVAEDYDLARADVDTVRVERAGQHLSGYLSLTAPRRYTRPPDRTAAVVHLLLDEVRTVRFDSSDGIGVTVTIGATEVEVRVGATGRLRAAAATVTFDDPSWHLSRHGRTADADTPRRDGPRCGRRKKTPQPRGTASDAAFVLREAMLQIRSVRYAKLVDTAPLRELCRAFTGAGDRLLTAATQPPSAREHTFRQLAEHWIGASPHLARTIARWLPDGHWLRQVSPTGPPRPTTAGMPTQAQFTLAGYTSDGTAVVNLAVPDDEGDWTLQALNFPHTKRLTLTTTPFTAPHAVSGALNRSLTVNHDALTITSHEPERHRHDAVTP